MAKKKPASQAHSESTEPVSVSLTCVRETRLSGVHYLPGDTLRVPADAADDAKEAGDFE